MFYVSQQFNQDLSGWDVSKSMDFRGMFAISQINQDLSSWDVSKSTDFREMFAYSQFNQDISGWDVSKAKDFQEMFAYSQFNQDMCAWGSKIDGALNPNLSDMFGTSNCFDEKDPVLPFGPFCYVCPGSPTSVPTQQPSFLPSHSPG